MIIPVFVTVSHATWEIKRSNEWDYKSLAIKKALLPLRQDPAWDEHRGLRQTLGRTSCLSIFKIRQNRIICAWIEDLTLCCIIKITFPINFVNHGLMRKSAAQYLCLQIANLPLTVNILLLYNSLWVELHPKRLFFLLDKFSASVCHQELQVQQHPMWPRPLHASCQMTGKTWNHIRYEKLRSQQLNKI